MKKILYAAVALVTSCIAMSSCGDSDNSWEEYTQWRNTNYAWYLACKDSTVNGVKYYQELAPSWSPKSGVLIHYFNDRSQTVGNLQPMLTSTVAVKYKGMLYNGVTFDSTTVATADSVRSFELTGLIEGWQIALQDMRVGDTCEIVLPYTVGYGVNGTTGISPYSTLKFGLKLVDIPAYEIRD